MLAQMPCRIKEAGNSIQFHPLCFRTIVVLLKGRSQGETYLKFKKRSLAKMIKNYKLSSEGTAVFDG